MISSNLKSLVTLVLGCVLVSGGTPTGHAAELVKLTVAEADPPEELAEPIRKVLQPKVVRLSEDGKTFYEFWLRKVIPLAKTPPPDGFALDGVEEGTVLGVLRVHDERYDFKDEEVPPGVYVMRFGRQPEDGDHLGTASSNAFALLVPAKDDRKLDALTDRDELSDAAAAVNAAEHPGNLNLQRVRDGSEQFPRLVTHERDEHELIYLRLPGTIKGREKVAMTLTFGLVYEGMGEI